VTERTPEQILNMMRYGACRVCGEPREARIEEHVEDGQRFAEHVLICPNGHRGW